MVKHALLHVQIHVAPDVVEDVVMHVVLDVAVDALMNVIVRVPIIVVMDAHQHAVQIAYNPAKENAMVTTHILHINMETPEDQRRGVIPITVQMVHAQVCAILDQMVILPIMLQTNLARVALHPVVVLVAREHVVVVVSHHAMVLVIITIVVEAEPLYPAQELLYYNYL